jgi:hypothetical protein
MKINSGMEVTTMTLAETAPPRWTVTEGLPFPLGPIKEEEDAYNFAPYSKHAQSVTLLLYTERDKILLEPGNKSPLQSMDFRVPGRAVVVLIRNQDEA